MARLGLFAIVMVAAITAIVFTIEPKLDLRIALFFRDYQASEAAQWLNAVFAFLRETNARLTVVLVALPILALVIKLVWPKRAMLIRPRAATLMIVTMLLGPGLLVNGILKEQWSRPRPGEVTEFGGPLAFKAWSDPTGECRSNCSFVSGESASAFWLLAPAAVLPSPWTVPALCGVLAYASAVGFSRVFTTGHFFTDVVFAAALVSFVVWIMHGLLFRWRATAPSDDAMERWIERCVYAAWSPFIAIGTRLFRRSSKDVNADG